MSQTEFNHLLESLAVLTPDQVDQLRRRLDSRLAASPPPAEETAGKPVWEWIQELTADVPDEEWDKLPADLAEQHNHYLYGTPKRSTA